MIQNMETSFRDLQKEEVPGYLFWIVIPFSSTIPIRPLMTTKVSISEKIDQWVFHLSMLSTHILDLTSIYTLLTFKGRFREE